VLVNDGFTRIHWEFFGMGLLLGAKIQHSFTFSYIRLNSARQSYTPATLLGLDFPVIPGLSFNNREKGEFITTWYA
jgi:hypothetical protein